LEWILKFWNLGASAGPQEFLPVKGVQW